MATRGIMQSRWWLCAALIYMWAQPWASHWSWEQVLSISLPIDQRMVCVAIPTTFPCHAPDRTSTMGPYMCLSVLSCCQSASTFGTVWCTTALHLFVGLLGGAYDPSGTCITVTWEASHLVGSNVIYWDHWWKDNICLSIGDLTRSPVSTTPNRRF